MRDGESPEEMCNTSKTISCNTVHYLPPPPATWNRRMLKSPSGPNGSGKTKPARTTSWLGLDNPSLHLISASTFFSTALRWDHNQTPTAPTTPRHPVFCNRLREPTPTTAHCRHDPTQIVNVYVVSCPLIYSPPKSLSSILFDFLMSNIVFLTER